MGVCCWSGNDDQMHESRHQHGAVGVISVTSNIVPALDDALDAKLQPLYKWLFTDPNPIGVNTMLMMLGAAKPVFRLPYTFVPRDRRTQGVELLTSIGLENCPAFGELKALEDLPAQHSPLDRTPIFNTHLERWATSAARCSAQSEACAMTHRSFS
eukprot:s923_g5.t1